MKKEKQQQQRESKQAQFLMSAANLFLNRRDLSNMTIQNDYGAISLSRDRTDVKHAVGFAAGDDLKPGDVDDDGDEVDKFYYRFKGAHNGRL